MGNLFPSLNILEAENNSASKVIISEETKSKPLFTSIEYKVKDIVNKIENIDNLDTEEIKRIILRQHQMILNYDLFLESSETRHQAQVLFTNKTFLNLFFQMIGLLDLTYHEKICLNKLAFDYHNLKDKDPEVSELLYNLTTYANNTQVMILCGIMDIYHAKIISMIRNSSFKEEKIVSRVNKYLVKCNLDLSVQNIIDIYTHIYDRFTYVFIYTMFESKPDNLTQLELKKFDNISIAIMEILDSMTSVDIRKVLMDYGFMISKVRTNITVRFSIKSFVRFQRIISIARDVEMMSEEIIIP